MPKIRCTFIINSLNSGGAERVISMMANYWARNGWDISLLLFDDEIPSFYEIDPLVCRFYLDIGKVSANPIAGIKNSLNRIKILRSAIINTNPDVIISFMSQINILVLLATRGLQVPVLVSERIDPQMHSIGLFWTKLRQLTYPLADRVVVQTKKAQTYFPAKLQKKIVIVPNPIVLPTPGSQLSPSLLGQHSLIAIGRLVPQKGFDLLLTALAKLKDRYPEWRLTILGEGASRPQLESLRAELGLSHLVDFLGEVKNPSTYLQQANIFIMSSRFEGFPNALCEAMACGLPVISTDCPSGPAEIIDNGKDGLLVENENVSALATAMEKLMSDEGERKFLATNALVAIQRFSIEKVMLVWEKLVNEVIQENNKKSGK
jgi:GalNAc-alpha-(1->4)-GalNAc-alpha-(1->3)-diNAcBac-PP-undecaprenol alpha-1,4-N-acetyl-D-galactosaminyltransferase